LAVALILLGGFAIAIYVQWDALDAWAPNVGVGAFSIAMTIVVVQRILEREAQRRLQPRVDRALDVLCQEFGKFVWSTYTDYIFTHLKPAPRATRSTRRQPLISG
jgi:hypothetical protein